MCGAAEDRGAEPNSCATNKGGQHLYLRDALLCCTCNIEKIKRENAGTTQCAVIDQHEITLLIILFIKYTNLLTN